MGSTFMFFGTMIYTTYQQAVLKKFVMPRSLLLLTMDVFAFAYMMQKGSEYDKLVKQIDEKYLGQGLDLL